jgi:hypothetical protein
LFATKGSLANSMRVVVGEARELCDLHRDYMLQLMEQVVQPLEVSIDF